MMTVGDRLFRLSAWEDVLRPGLFETDEQFAAGDKGRRKLPWVAARVKQETEHVEYSNHALQLILTEDEQRRVVYNAEEMWTLWLNFFTSLRGRIL